MPEPMEQVLVRMPPDLYAAVKERAGVDDRSAASVIRLAVSAYLDGEPDADPADRTRQPDPPTFTDTAPPRLSDVQPASFGKGERVGPLGADATREDRLGGARQAVKPEPCRHPQGRRIGNGCGACGKILK